MKKLNLTVLLLTLSLGFFQACASKKVRRAKGPSTTQSKSGTSMPEWVNSPGDACPKSYICAVAEGGGHMVAKANARKAMGKVFETRVKSKTSVNTTSSSKSSADNLESDGTFEDFASQVEEVSDEVLKGVEIEATWEDPNEGTVFALAKLSRRGAKDRFRNEMKSLDDKIAELYKDGSRAKLNKIVRLFDVRENFNKRYEVVAGTRYPRKTSLKKVMAAKRKKAAQNVTIYVDLKAVEQSKEIGQLITALLLDNDYLVVKKSNKKHDFVLKGTLSTERQHMNVDGWEKYKFLLKLRALNKSGTRVGALNFAETKPGRDVTQAYESSIPAIKKFLIDNLDQLNMD